jgi:hypothetical protein
MLAAAHVDPIPTCCIPVLGFHSTMGVADPAITEARAKGKITLEYGVRPEWRFLMQLF